MLQEKTFINALNSITNTVRTFIAPGLLRPWIRFLRWLGTITTEIKMTAPLQDPVFSMKILSSDANHLYLYYMMIESSILSIKYDWVLGLYRSVSVKVLQILGLVNLETAMLFLFQKVIKGSVCWHRLSPGTRHSSNMMSARLPAPHWHLSQIQTWHGFFFKYRFVVIKNNDMLEYSQICNYKWTQAP